MTVLRSKNIEDTLFQKCKMDDKAKFVTIKPRNLQMDILIKDILKRIADLKRTANELEDIVKELQKKEDSVRQTQKCTNNEKKDIDNLVKSDRHLVHCDLCNAKFKVISNLEKHIKRNHEDYQTHDCERCSKTFVTKWRLQKHAKMHHYTKLRHCRYFRNEIVCPFDELGCKFRHDTETQDRTSQSEENSERLINSSSDIQKNSGQFEDMLGNSSFLTSTPKKTNILGHSKYMKEKLKCEDCIDMSQCTDCYVNQHMQNQHKRNMTNVLKL